MRTLATLIVLLGGCALLTPASEERSTCDSDSDCDCGEHCAVQEDGARACVAGCQSSADCRDLDRCGGGPEECDLDTGRCEVPCAGRACGATCCPSFAACAGPEGDQCCTSGVACGGACCPSALDVCDPAGACASR
jgi:hypothetical protein